MFRQSTLFDYWKSDASDIEDELEGYIEQEQGVDNIDPLIRFKNLYWSRLISLQDFKAGENERWDMKPDIKENKEILAEIELNEDESNEPYFDPYVFCKINDELTFDQYRLNNEQLKQHAIKASQIRTKIEEKSESLKSFNDSRNVIEDSLRDLTKYLQIDVAKRYHVSTDLVGRLCRSIKKDHAMLEKAHTKSEENKQLKENVYLITKGMLERNRPIWKAQKIKKVSIQANSERCLILRQQYALKIMEFLSQGKRIINVDESWIAETQYNRRMWCPTNAPCTITDHAVNPRLALIAALDTDGRVYFSLNHSNTDSDVILLFLRQLVSKLNDDIPGWMSDSVILLDNAKYHTSEDTQEALLKLKIPYMFSGPYSYSSAPIELMFSGLKNGQLQSLSEPTGKKALPQLIDSVALQLAQIPLTTRVRYWHHTALELFKYLYYQRI